MANIRPAMEEELTALVNMARDMHDESPYFSRFEFSAVKTANTLLGLMTHPEGCVLVAVIDSEVIGMFGGFITEHFFGNDRYACDIGLYVKPEHRGGSVAVRLLKVFEEWVSSKNVGAITLGVSTEVEVERTAAMYQHLGYTASGVIVRKER